MPELGAYQENVQFNWCGAAVLAAELRATATLLDWQVGERRRIAGGARAKWEGAYGGQFDGRVVTCTGDATRFATSMRDAADMLDELARLAREEQDRRVAARAWVAKQNSGGGFLGLGHVTDAIGDWVSGDDMPPPPPPVEPPTIPVYDTSPAARGPASPGVR